MALSRTAADLHDECRSAVRPCLGCKLLLWRLNGVPVRVPQHFDTSGPTVREAVNDMHERYKQNGGDVRNLERV
jgi:hypothetical protein